MKVKFGAGQWKNATPVNYDRFVKMFIGINGIFLAWMTTNNIISHHAQDIITPIVNLINSILLFLLPFFGVETSRTSVPIDEVKVIENK